MSQYSIKDLETFTGIKAHTIRMWEKRYGVVEPGRTQTNIRTYDDDDLKRLLNISILNRHGYRISEIMRMSEKEICDRVLQITHKSLDTQSQIENLVLAMIDLDEEYFEKILTQSIIKIGFEDTVKYLIYPFFERIGVLWQAGSIIPAQEHFISNLIRQKLIVAIDSIITPRKDQALTYLLFLPEGEWHEMGLLFTQYLLKKWGHRVIYLGQHVPLNNLSVPLQRTRVDYIVTQFITGITPEALRESLHLLASLYPEHRFLVSGRQLIQFKPVLPPNFELYDSLENFKDLISRHERLVLNHLSN
ncbi:MAG: MerR family transcriptional regulator [Bacteroidales bacterium]